MQSRMDEFKDFVKRHPRLRDEVRNNGRTWQNIYEEWVLYGEEDPMWDAYRVVENDSISLDGNLGDNNMDNIKSIVSYIQKLDPDKLQKTLNTIQKAVQIAQSITGNKKKHPAHFNHYQGSMYDDWWD